MSMSYYMVIQRLRFEFGMFWYRICFITWTHMSVSFVTSPEISIRNLVWKVSILVLKGFYCKKSFKKNPMTRDIHSVIRVKSTKHKNMALRIAFWVDQLVGPKFAIRFPHKHSKFGTDKSICPECNAWHHLFAYGALYEFTMNTYTSANPKKK